MERVHAAPDDHTEGASPGSSACVADSYMQVNTAFPKGVRVLLVDEHDDTRDLYAEYLALHGADVSTASGAREARERARRHAPDVVVTELVRTGGLSLLRQLRRDPRTARSLLVVLTATSDDELHARARSSCDVLLTKPSGPDELLRLLAACVAREIPGESR
jgi:CheY-like chemotaxis protein